MQLFTLSALCIKKTPPETYCPVSVPYADILKNIAFLPFVKISDKHINVCGNCYFEIIIFAPTGNGSGDMRAEPVAMRRSHCA